MFTATGTPDAPAPLGSESGSGICNAEGQSDCAPTELRSKEQAGSYKHLAP